MLLIYQHYDSDINDKGIICTLPILGNVCMTTTNQQKDMYG